MDQLYRDTILCVFSAFLGAFILLVVQRLLKPRPSAASPAAPAKNSGNTQKSSAEELLPRNLSEDAFAILAKTSSKTPRRRSTTENTQFRVLFPEIEDDQELLLKDWFCALKKTIMHAGRLYVTHRRCCFHYRLMANAWRISCPWDDVQDIVKVWIEGVNQGIEINFKHPVDLECYTSKDKSQRVSRIRLAWFQSWSEVLGATRALLAQSRGEIVPEVGDKLSPSFKQDSSPELPNFSESFRRVPSESGPLAMETSLQEVPMTTVINRHDLHVPLSFVISSLEGNLQTSRFGQLVVERFDYTDVKVGEWHSGSIGEMRSITLNAKVPPQPMCPSRSNMSCTHHMCKPADEKEPLVYERASITHDVPYGTYFQAEDSWCFEPHPQNSNHVIVTVQCRVVFNRSTMLRSKIESTARVQTTKAAEELLQILQDAFNSQ